MNSYKKLIFLSFFVSFMGQNSNITSAELYDMDSDDEDDATHRYFNNWNSHNNEKAQKEYDIVLGTPKKPHYITTLETYLFHYKKAISLSEAKDVDKFQNLIIQLLKQPQILKALGDFENYDLYMDLIMHKKFENMICPSQAEQ